jgi:hypothetical protein
MPDGILAVLDRPGNCVDGFESGPIELRVTGISGRDTIYRTLRPWMMRSSTTMMAITRSTWMKPFRVKDVRRPSNQSTKNITASVQSMSHLLWSCVEGEAAQAHGATSSPTTSDRKSNRR